MQIYNPLVLAGIFITPFLAVLIPIYIGRQYGKYRSRKLDELQHTPVGTVVGAAFGLLAFMLAFTFQIVSDRFEARKALLLEEITDIRTAFLRSGLLKEPMRTESRKLLVEYADLRADLSKDITRLDSVISRSHQIVGTLWNYSETLAEEDRSSEVYAMYTTSVNDLVDVLNQRLTMTFEYRIPALILWILFIITFFSMLTLGYQFGISGKGSFVINFFLAIIFAAVMFLIVALDRPETGIIRLNQKPIFSLQVQLHDLLINEAE